MDKNNEKLQKIKDEATEIVDSSIKKAKQVVHDAPEQFQKAKDYIAEHAPEEIEKAKKTAGKVITYGIRQTRELTFYLLKFAFRIALFLGIFITYIFHREWLEDFMTKPFLEGLSIFHIIWGIFMVIMLSHLIPNNRLTMAWQKARESAYEPVENYDQLALLKYVQTQNIRAWRVMLVWLSFNAIFGVLYLVGVLQASDLMMLSIFYFLSDFICILLFCPFQNIIMRNKCCVNCRIYDWGHFMMFTPLLFIKNFYSWSLFFTSIVVLIHWEVQYAKHPERFWEGSNKTLKCTNCKEKTCQIKRKLNGTLPKFIEINFPPKEEPSESQTDEKIVEAQQ